MNFGNSISSSIKKTKVKDGDEIMDEFVDNIPSDLLAEIADVIEETNGDVIHDKNELLARLARNCLEIYNNNPEYECEDDKLKFIEHLAALDR